MKALLPRGWFRRRECWWPTWRSWAALAVVGVLGLWIFTSQIHGFLAVSEPIPARILVVEGWLSDEALVKAAAEFNRGNYRVLVTTGIPLDSGHFLVEYGNYAELARATLGKIGVDPAKIRPAPAPRVIRHRTYESAVAFRDWLQRNNASGDPINLFTSGTHSRRSRLVYESVLGCKVGVISVPEKNYDPDRWWLSSQGVKAVLEEIIGYCYTRLRKF